MKITPSLPGPYQPPAGQPQTLSPVEAPSRVRDAADEARNQRHAPRRIDQAERERLAERLVERQPHPSTRSSRALASYAEVSGNAERSDLRDVLGFDAYA